MGEHRALRAARRARSVEDGREIVGRARDRRQFAPRRRDRLGEPAVAARAETFDRRQGQLGSERAHRLEARGAAQRQRRPGVGEEIFEFGQGIGGIERQQRRPRAETRQRQHDRVGRFVDLRGDPVARLDAEIDQRARGAPRPRVQFAVAERMPIRALDRDFVEARRAGDENFEEIGGNRHGQFRSRRGPIAGARERLRPRRV